MFSCDRWLARLAKLAGGVAVIKVGGAKMKISTNCAAAIGVGDQFGVLKVVGWKNADHQVCYDEAAGASEQDVATASSHNGESDDSISSVAIAGIVVGIIASVILAIAAGIAIKKVKANKADAWPTAQTQ